MVMATVAATCTRDNRWESAGMMSAQSLAEALDARAGLTQRLRVGGVADAEMAGIHEGRAMHGGHALFLQQRDHEILVAADRRTALAGLADAAMHGGEHIERALRLLADQARRSIQHIHHQVPAL